MRAHCHTYKRSLRAAMAIRANAPLESDARVVLDCALIYCYHSSPPARLQHLRRGHSRRHDYYIYLNKHHVLRKV